VELLLDGGAEINSLDRWGGTPLHDALRERHPAVASVLYQRGGHLGITPLELGVKLNLLAMSGKVEMLSDFVANGADVNSKDYDGRSPLHVATAEGNKAVVEYLVKQGARADVADRWGNTAGGVLR